MNKKLAFASITALVVCSTLVTITASAKEQERQQGDQRGRTQPMAPGAMHNIEMMRNRPAVMGQVASISGSTLTVTGMNRVGSTTSSISYTVDASNAKIDKQGTTTTLSSIAVGDTVAVSGTVTNTSIVATTIRIGLKPGEMPVRGNKNNDHRASSTIDRKDGDSKRGGPGHGDMMHASSTLQGTGQSMIAGIVSSLSGNSITLSNKNNIVYTVDAASTTIRKTGTITTLSSIVIGDRLLVQGVATGTSITASNIIDQGPQPTSTPSRPKNGNGGDKKGIVGGIMSSVGGLFHKMFSF